MNFLFTQQILFFLVSAVGSAVAIFGLFFKEWITNKKHLRRFLGIGCMIIAGAYAANCAYIEIINMNQIYSDLYITIALPYLVNVDGTHKDPFIQDADYSVVAYNPILSLETKIELLNVKTYEKFVYNPSFADFGLDLSYRLANVSSGEYDIKIFADDYPLYEERIVLNAQNFYSDDEIGTYRWNFTAFIFDDFYDDTVCFDIYLGDVEGTVTKPLFGIWSENTGIYEMFKTEVDWNNNGHMAGKFYGYKDVYFVGNAMTDTKMETVIVDVTEY